MARIIRKIHQQGNKLRSLSGLAVLSLGLFLIGCDTDDPVVVDMIPPAVPSGVFTITGDAVVSVYWNDIYTQDLSGYDIYRHSGNEPIEGKYEYLGTVDWNENYLEDSLLHWFDDFDVTNGETYYYAVLSFDEAGNESYLSFEIVVDTPRPEGSGVLIYDDNVDPQKSGFDFSRLNLGLQAGAAPSTDIIVEFSSGIPYVSSARPLVVEIQDYGTRDLVNVDYAPDSGYSETGHLELIEYHAYIVRITESAGAVNYAKFQVVARGPGSILIDWAYQTDNNNRELSILPGLPNEPVSGYSVPRNDIIRF